VDFVAVVDQVITLLRQRGRVTYRTLQLQFTLDDEQLAALKDELLYSQPHVVDEAGRGLVWTGDTGATPALSPSPPSSASSALPHTQTVQGARLSDDHAAPEAERRRLTVLFCDLVDSTPLASQLDPEDYREVVRAYQAACAEVIQQFDGHIAQLLGDGLLVYFGYPQAHEDDAPRAVRTGLGMVETMGTLNVPLEQKYNVRLAVRIGIHTGLAVVSEMGGSGRQEQLALGETPNIAARLQGLAAPDTVVISEATSQLIRGYFVCQALGTQGLKGVSQPLMVYQVLRESEAQTPLDVAATRGLTPLVGRDSEVTVLRERWAQVKDGIGQVVLLTGEAGIGKSRLVHALKEHLAAESYTRIECRCSSYYQHTALYPVSDVLERMLSFRRDEAPEEKVQRLEVALAQYRLALQETVPLFAALLSLPLSDERDPPLQLTPQRQRQKTLEAIVAIVLELAERQPVLFVVEDLHWVDPSTLELLDLLITQGPTAAILTLVTYRPEFQPPWGSRTHFTPLALQRLPRPQVEAMIERITGGTSLPPEVTQHVVINTDGVPLFVEELTKMVLESGWLREQEGHYALTGPLPPLAIPATLHGSLMARLDRLGPVKAIVQLGATLGRTFSYDLLHAVAPLEEGSLQHGLRQLVEAELLYQRGVPPQATYHFKHGLIQEAAYQSLLKSTRQQYHQRIAQVLEVQFPETIETKPELLAHHYTVAGLVELAIDYWHKAGQYAVRRSAHLEAISHLEKALELLQTLPDTLERAQQELDVQLTLGIPLSATRGYAVPEVAHIYTRAQALCQRMGETPQLIPALLGLWRFYLLRAEVVKARELAEQCLLLLQRVDDPTRLIVAHDALGETLVFLGDFVQARAHLERATALYDPQKRRSPRALTDPGVSSLALLAGALWMLGYPAQALQRSTEALRLAEAPAHPYILASTLVMAAYIPHLCRDVRTTQVQAEAVVTLATAQGFPFWLADATIFVGWAQAAQGRGAEGLAQIQHGMAARQALGLELARPVHLTMLAEAYENVGQPAAGLTVLAEALTRVDTTRERWWEAELHRLRGELLLALSAESHTEAETCFQQALTVARRQQAKSWELRAAISLSHLWQRQGKRAEAYELLAPIYGWFTEGLDTANLQEAKALLEALA